ncbi:glycine cleavage system protein H [Spiribacter salinus M19-40]|uniref:Glycine cleavage system H protein n=1 Tax=Spiribacter salinus M19-40 TaxID=1260251 RepID=R4VQM2_9GAMM|nr:glycine cleavage system protein GcvH [Spiribacter salinus]AGM41723.1 glycine cleavage system protein H [Spiribacter salinus M19-40]
MSDIPADLKYTATHEWVRDEGDGHVTVGITEHAQASLGDLVFVELPEGEGTVEAGAACAVVESVKAASDIYAPVDGEVTGKNERLSDEPELINSDPYGEGWIFTMTLADAGALTELLDAEGYADMVAEEE